MKLFSWVSPLSSEKNYRPDIDGLRAVAVLLVVLFHGFPIHFPGGFIGVDVFFVISGFLISSIIFAHMQSNKFTLLDFYRKRINRIFPALILVFIVCLIASKWILFREEQVDFNKALFFSTSFLANIYLLTKSNYFDASSETNPLLHMWSLGVEEQFYILWPLLLMLLWKMHHRKVLAVIGLIALISFALCLDMVARNQTLAFYMPITRFWELAIGSLFAYYLHQENRKGFRLAFSRLETSPWRHPVSILGIGLIVFGVFHLSTASTFPGVNALIPVIGSMCIILAGKDALFNKFVLSNRAMVFIGAISFPFYLWHWPILSFLQIQLGPLSREVRMTAVAVSLLLAILTYFMVEKPVRFSIKSQKKSLILFLIMVAVALYAVMDWVSINSQPLTKQDVFLRHYKNYVSEHKLSDLYRTDCSLINLNGSIRNEMPASCITPTQAKSVFIWGDSHAQHLYYGLRKTLPENVSLLQVASYGCAPSITPHGKLNCDNANARALDAIKQVKPDIVLLAQRDHHESNDFAATAEYLKNAGVKHVVLLGPVPQWTENLSRIYAQHYLDSKPRYLGNYLNEDIFKTDRYLQDKYQKSDVLTYVSATAGLCQGKKCMTYFPTAEGYELTTFDYGHLTLETSHYVAETLLVPTIQALENTNTN
jgi:peptidoglycan/LPS O-acetylase OafA/YrhL